MFYSLVCLLGCKQYYMIQALRHMLGGKSLTREHKAAEKKLLLGSVKEQREK